MKLLFSTKVNVSSVMEFLNGGSKLIGFFGQKSKQMNDFQRSRCIFLAGKDAIVVTTSQAIGFFISQNPSKDQAKEHKQEAQCAEKVWADPSFCHSWLYQDFLFQFANSSCQDL